MKKFTDLKKSCLRVLVFVAVLFVANKTIAQASYVWNGANNASWAVATNWTPNRTTPNNGDDIYINSTSTITITNVQGNTLRSLTINAGSGTVTLTSTTAKTISLSGTGSFLTINGNLILGGSVSINKGNSTGSTGTVAVGKIFNIGANNFNWRPTGASLTINGSLISSAGSTVTFDFNPHTLPANMILGGNLTLAGGNKTMSGDLTVSGSLTTSNNLIIGSNTLSINGTVYGLSNGGTSLVGSSTSNLIIGGTGNSGEIDFDQTTAGTTNQLNNLTLNRTGTVTLGNALVMGTGGTLTMTAGALALATTDPALTINGAVTNSGTGTVTGNASAGLVIGGTGDAVGSLYFTSGAGQNVYSLIIDRKVGGIFNLGTPLNINSNAAGALTLNNGILNTGGNLLTMISPNSSLNTITGGSPTSYIRGPLARAVFTNGSPAAYTWPIGKAAYQLFTLNVTSNTDFFNIALIRAEAFDASSGGSGDVTYDLRPDNYWSASVTANSGSITSFGTTSLTDASPAILGTDVVMYSANNTTYSTLGGAVAGSIITSTSLSTPLALGYFNIGTQKTCNAVAISTSPSSPSAICESGTVTMTVSVTGDATFNYQWQVDNSGWTNLTNGGGNPYNNSAVTTGSASTTNTLTITNPSYSLNGKQYRCVITNCSSASSATSAAATLSVYQTPTVTSSSTGTVCSGVSQNYNITGGTTYTWSRSAVTNISNSALSGQTNNPITETLINTSTSNVNVTYLITPTANGCSGPQFAYTVTVKPTPAVSSLASGSICSGAAQNYNITTGVSGTTYSWSRATVADISPAGVSGQTSNPITETLTNAITSNVIVTYLITPSANGCTGVEFTRTVTVKPTPSVNSASTGTANSGEAQNYEITSTLSGSTYIWSRAAVTNISNTAVSGQTSVTITEILHNTTVTGVNAIYLITPTANSCSGAQFSYTVTVNPVPPVRYAVASGNWSGAIWASTSGGVAGSAATPTSLDAVIINSGVNVTVTANAFCTTLDIGGGGSPGGTLNVEGHNLTPSGALTVNNYSSINFVTSTSGTKTFADIIINSGGAWNNTINEAISSSGSITNNGTINNAGSSAFTLTSTGSINGTNPITIGSLTIGGSIAITNNATLTTSTLTVTGTMTNNSTLTASASLAGTGKLINNAPGYLNIGDNNPGITTLDASTAGNTVNYNLSGDQTIKSGGMTYHNLILSGSGIKTLNSSPSGGITTNGNLTVNSGVNFAMGNNPLILKGNLINTGTVGSSSGLLTITGNASQSIGTMTLGGSVIISKSSGAATFTGNVSGGTLTMGGGTLNLGTVTHTFDKVILTSGNLNGGSSTLNLTSASPWEGNGSLFTCGTGTVVFVGGAQELTTNNTTTFWNLIFGGSSGNKTLHNSQINVNGILTINSIINKAELIDGSNNTVNILMLGGAYKTAGTWGSYSSSATNKDDNYFYKKITGSTGYLTVTTSASNPTDYFRSRATGNWSSATSWESSVNGTSNWGNATLAPTNAAAGITIQNTHNITIDQNNQTASTIVIENGGTLTNNGANNLNVSGDWTNNGGTFSPNTGTVSFSGTMAQAINGSASSHTFNNLTLNSGHTLEATTSSLIINGISSISNTSSLTTSALTIGGTMTNNGALTVLTTLSGVGTLTQGASGYLYLGDPNPGITTLNTSTAGNTVNYNSAGAQTIRSATYSNLILSGSGTKTLTSGGITTNGALTLESGITFNIADVTYTLDGDFVNNGGAINSSSGGNITIAGTATQSIGGFAIMGSGGNINMTKTGGTATFIGNVSTPGGLTINGAGGTLTLGFVTYTFGNDVTLISGTLNGGFSILNVNSSTATAWGGTGSNFVCGTGTVIFGGTAQTLSATTTTFYNLILGGSGTKTIQDAIPVSNTLTINTGVKATLSAGTNSTVNSLMLGGAYKAAETWGGTTSGAANINTTFFNASTGYLTVTVVLSSATDYFRSKAAGNWSDITIWEGSSDGINWFNATLAPTSAASRITIQNLGTVTVNIDYQTASTIVINNGATLINSGANNLYVSGDWTNNGGTYTANTGTVTFNGTGAQAIGGTSTSQTFNNIAVSKSAQTLTAPATLNINGNLSLEAGTLTAGADINITGNFTKTGGTFTHNSGTVSFNKIGAQSISNVTYNNLILSGSGNKTMSSGNTTIDGIFDIKSGVVASLTSGSNNPVYTLKFNGTTQAAGKWGSTTANKINKNDTYFAATTGFLTVSGPTPPVVYFRSKATGDWSSAATWETSATLLGTYTPAAAAPDNNATLITVQSTHNVTIDQNNLTASTIIIESGATLTNSGTNNLFIGGNWTNNGGTFIANTGTVTFYGIGTQTIGGTLTSQTFNNIILNSDEILNATAVSTLLTMNNLTLTAGNFIAGANTNIKGNWTNNGGTFTAGTGTVTFNGTGTQTIGGTTTSQGFYNLTLSSGNTLDATAVSTLLSVNNLTITSGSFASPATLTMDGSFALAAGGTFTAGATTNIKGNWTNNGGTFTQGTGTVIFNGSGAQAINGSSASQTFNNITVNKSSQTLTAPATLNINGNMTLTAGTFTAGANINIAGDWTKTGGTFTHNSGTVTYNGTGGQQVAVQTYWNLTFSGSGNKSITSASTVINGILSFTGSALANITNLVNVPVNVLMFGVATQVAGTWGASTSSATHINDTYFTATTGYMTVTASTSPTDYFRSVAAGNWSSPAAWESSANGTTNWGNATQAPSSAAALITIQNTGTVTVDVNDQTASTIVINNGATLANSGTHNLNVSGNWTNNGTFAPSTGTVTFNGSGIQTINGSNPLSLYNLIVPTGKTVTNSAILTASTLTVTGTMTNSSMITTADMPLTGSMTNNATLIISSSIRSTGTLTNGINSSLYIADNVVAPNLIASATGNTVYYNALGNQIMKSGGMTYYNLVLSGSGEKHLNTDGMGITTNGNLTVNSGVSFFLGAQPLTLKGDLINNGGTITGTLSTVSISGNAATQSIAGFSLSVGTASVTMNKTGGTATFTGDVTTICDLTVVGTTGGTLNLGSGTHRFANVILTSGTCNAASSMLEVTGGIENSWTGTTGIFNAETGTVDLGGLGTQTIVYNTTFNNLILSGANVKTLTGVNATINGNFIMAGTAITTAPRAFTIKGSVTLESGSRFTSGAFTHNVGGDWTNNGGTFIAGTGTITFNGTAIQTIKGNASAFNNITISNSTTPYAVQLNGSSMQINGAYTQSINGLLLTRDYDLIFGESATVNITSPSSLRMIVADGSLGTGQVKKMFSSTGSFTFPIGDNTGGADYSPVVLNLTTNSVSRIIGVKVTTPNPTLPAATPTNYIRRYWSFTDDNSEQFNFNYTLDLFYAAGDVLVPGTESSLSGYLLKNGTTWINAPGTLTTATHNYLVTPAVDGSAYPLDHNLYTLFTCTPPSAPTVADPQYLCSGSTVASLTATGIGVLWYAGTVGGTAKLPTEALVNGANYYASQTIACESTERSSKVTVSFYVVPAPTGIATQSFCLDNSPTIGSLTATGTTIKWYATQSGFPALGISTLLTNGTPHYYASQTSIEGCESTSRFDVTATVSPCNSLWTGTTSTNWNINTNWNPIAVPVSTTNITIPYPLSNGNFPLVSLASTAVCNNITINSNASLTVNGILATSGSMIIKSDINGTGAFVQRDGASVTIPGNVTVERYLPSLGYHYISSPSNSATVNQINGFTTVGLSSPNSSIYYSAETPLNPFPNIWEMDEQHSHDGIQDINAWKAPYDGEPMNNMKGYAINITSAKTVNLTVTGSLLNTGNKTYALTKSEISTDTYHSPYNSISNPGGGHINVDIYGSTVSSLPKLYTLAAGPTSGWHMVGNPYPSAVDWELVNADAANAGISGGIWYFQPTSQWVGNYGLYQGGAGSSGAFLTPSQTQYIPVMGAFMINANSIGTSYLTFKNIHRSGIATTNNSGPHFYKKASEEFPLLRLTAYMGDNSDKSDMAVICFKKEANDTYNMKLDAIKIMNTDYPNIYSVISGNNLAVKTFPSSALSSFSVPLGFNVNAYGKHIINAAEINNFPAGTEIYLIDMKKGVSQDLTVKPTYTFNITGNEDNRFFIKFTNKLSVTNDPQLSLQMCNIYSTDNNLFVDYFNPTGEKAEMSIFNITGQLESSIRNLETGTFHTALKDAPGIYFVKVVTSSRIYIQKIVVN